MKLLILFITLLVAPLVSSGQASAYEWTTGCGRSDQESIRCQHIKGDAILAGSQGVLHTIAFPNGVKYQYFYTGGPLCNFEGLMVRKTNRSWFKASAYCTEKNRLVFQLPSGNTFFWINAYVD